MPFLDLIYKNPDWLVIDIGAHVGQYSLFAAKMGHNVLSVEPFHDNILRIHKAATYEHLQDKITLIKNGVSNKRNELKLLQKVSSNIGGQGLLEKHKKTMDKYDPFKYDKKYLVETILMDDLVNFIPKLNNSNSTYKKAILKIDIEGYEPFAFLSSKTLFTQLDVRVIIMEWGSFAHRIELYGLIRKMILFLTSLSYYPYDFNVALSTRNWHKWPWDVIWKKID